MQAYFHQQNTEVDNALREIGQKMFKFDKKIGNLNKKMDEMTKLLQAQANNSKEKGS